MAEPLGTPVEIVTNSDIEPFTTTACLLSDK